MAGGQKAVLLQHKQSNTSSSSSSSSTAQQGDGTRTQQPSAAAGAVDVEEGVTDLTPEGFVMIYKESEGSVREGGGGGGEFGVGGTASEEQQHVVHGVDVDLITCMDVVMALQEVGESLSHCSLEQYIHSVHGSNSVVYVSA